MNRIGISMVVEELQRELFEDTGRARRVLDKALDPTLTYEMARDFDHPNPRPVKRAGYDPSLIGTGIEAYVVDIPEVKEEYPVEGKRLERQLGSEPVMGINPYLLKLSDEEIDSVLDHEKTHPAQPGKLRVKEIVAMTPYGMLPLGEMIVEGAVEYRLERRYKSRGESKKVSSRHFEKRHRHIPLYSFYRDLAYELEEKQPGVLNRIFRAARREGAEAAMDVIAKIPEIDKIVTKYASRLYSLN